MSLGCAVVCGKQCCRELKFFQNKSTNPGWNRNRGEDSSMARRKNTKTWKKQQGVSTTQSWPHVLPFMSPKLLVFDQSHSHQTYLDEFSGLQNCCRMQRVSGRRLVADLGIQHDSAQISLRTCPDVVQVWSGSHRIHNCNPPSKYPKLKSDGKRSRDPSNGGV